MEKPERRHVARDTTDSRPGTIAHAKRRSLHSCRLGALPILQRLLERMRLEEFLRSYLPRADRRCRIDPAIGVTLLLKNLLLAREPLYGVGEWAARHVPEVLGLDHDPVAVRSTTIASAVVSTASSTPTSPHWLLTS